MAKPRQQQVIKDAPGFYHCISRCVRRTFLCGIDPISEKDFSHRRDWLVERMKLLSECFAIDIYAYAIMSNHCHGVMYIDPERVKSWSDKDVARRWKTIGQWRNPDKPLVIPENVSPLIIKVWRERLASISWYMRSLKEPLARIANKEDDCTGRFWEGRFKSIALLDEAAVISCMAYVDLNPMRAGIADSLETSDFTSIQTRILEQLDRTNSETANEAGDKLDTSLNR